MDYADPINTLGQEVKGYPNAYYSNYWSNINDVPEEDWSADLHAIYDEFTDMVLAADRIISNRDARLAAFAEAEEYLIENALVVPSNYISSYCLTKIDPETKLSKGKDWLVYNEPMTGIEIPGSEPAPEMMSITILDNPNGMVSVDKTEAAVGEIVTVTATPNEGYVLSAILVNGSAIEGTTFEVSGNHTVSATFTLVERRVLAEGTCNADGDENRITWTLYEDGEMVISGTGSMADYGLMEVPWSVYRPWIKKVTVEANIIHVGANAFAECDNLEEVNINGQEVSTYGLRRSSIAGVTIGENAFGGCDSLNSVSMKGVTEIGASAFEGCSALTNIEIPETVTTIEESAFAETGLTSVEIPASVTTLEANTFANCEALSTVSIPESVTDISETTFGDDTSTTNVQTVYYAGTEEQWQQAAGNTAVNANTDVQTEVQTAIWTISTKVKGKGTVVVSPATMLETAENKTVTITVTATDGYELAALLVDGIVVNKDSFVASGNHTVSAVFTEVILENSATASGSIDIPISNSEVAPVVAVALLDAEGKTVKDTILDANGKYNLTNVPAGTYTLSMAADGRVARTETVTVSAGDSVDIGEFKLCKLGDVNMDGSVTTGDVDLLFRRIGKTEGYETNKDGIATTGDVDLLFRSIK